MEFPKEIKDLRVCDKKNCKCNEILIIFLQRLT